MKCPKCGSEKFHKTFTRSRGHTFWQCKGCYDYEPTYEEVKVIKHQQRLDKVLSKFKKNKGGYIYEEKDLWIEYNWYDKKDNKFRMGLFYSIIISLKTVESLLNDLQLEKNN